MHACCKLSLRFLVWSLRSPLAASAELPCNLEISEATQDSAPATRDVAIASKCRLRLSDELRSRINRPRRFLTLGPVGSDDRGSIGFCAPPGRFAISSEERIAHAFIDLARGRRACLCLRAFVADADQFAPVPIDAHDAPLPFPRCKAADERAKHQPIEGHIEELSGGPLRKVERGGSGGFSDIHAMIPSIKLTGKSGDLHLKVGGICRMLSAIPITARIPYLAMENDLITKGSVTKGLSVLALSGGMLPPQNRMRADGLSVWRADPDRASLVPI